MTALDKAKVFVVLVDDDDEYDAQVFQSQQDAQTYCVELVLDYLKQNPMYDDGDPDIEESWTETITTFGDPPTQYEAAIECLYTEGVEDLGVLIVERHIATKVWEDA